MDVIFTVDVEEDCPPYLNSWLGLTEGVPRLLEILREFEVPATFFCTAESAQKHPQAIEKIVKSGAELGSHGSTHRKFTEMTPSEIDASLGHSREVLSNFGEVLSFRAPYLKFPENEVFRIKKAGYRIDSSQARYKKIFPKLHLKGGLIRIPASVTSAAIRYPRWIRGSLLAFPKEPLVLFVHPWEFVDFRRSKLRIDCRFRTGDKALLCLGSLFRSLQRNGANFQTLGDYARKNFPFSQESPKDWSRKNSSDSVESGAPLSKQT